MVLLQFLNFLFSSHTQWKKQTARQNRRCLIYSDEISFQNLRRMKIPEFIPIILRKRINKNLSVQMRYIRHSNLLFFRWQKIFSFFLLLYGARVLWLHTHFIHDTATQFCTICVCKRFVLFENFIFCVNNFISNKNVQWTSIKKNRKRQTMMCRLS